MRAADYPIWCLLLATLPRPMGQRYGVHAVDILACPQAALSALGSAMRCPAAGASWGAPSALLAAPSRLPRRSFGHLRQLLGNTSRRPLPYPPLITPLGKSPSPELPSPKLWAESCATELHCLPRHRQASPRFCHPQQVAGGVACESDYIPRRAIVGPLHIPEIWARISSAALWKFQQSMRLFSWQ